MKTRADRDKRYRANLKERGLVTVRVIAYPEDKEDILAYGHSLKKDGDYMRKSVADFIEAAE